MNRSVLGLSTQYYKELVLVSRCLGVIELTDRHTAAYLKTEIIDTAAKYGILPWQFYSATIDNAKNGVKCVDEIAAVQEEDIIKEYFPDAASEDAEDEYDPSFEDPKVALCAAALDVCFVECVRCGAHTLNLVVNDATKQHESELKEITKIVKSYRKAEYMNRFKNTGVPLPPIPCKTRWNHYFLMTRLLNKNHDFFNGLGIKYPELDLSEQWKLIEEYNEAFEPLYHATINAQALDCPISNFHLEWLKAYGRVMQNDNNRFKQPILESMQKRQKLMMSSMAYKAALYMDPRFSFNGSELFEGPEKEEVVDFLAKLWRKIKTHDDAAKPPEEPQATSELVGNESFNVDNFFTQMFGQGSSQAGASEDKLKKKLTNIQFQNRVPASDANFNIIHYYFSNRSEDEQLWKIAKVVFAAAATQAEVEREFTQFNNVYTSLRNRLKGKNTDNILKIKLNQDLLPLAIPAAIGNNTLPQAY
ncbi:hypothetical protein pipiens_010797 [Culex pipiens pipiens]|uniref:HAT C-terminal dimerisation domain-containing protein n=1 Tax=Culex pipiens pipiens TaxID=38569 RepID=A0ABD1D9B4_CULPP